MYLKNNAYRICGKTCSGGDSREQEGRAILTFILQKQDWDFGLD
jgi:hypothetical protein